MRISDWSSDVCSSDLRRKIGCLHSEVRRKLFLYAENNVAGTLNNLPQSTALCRVCDFQTCVGRHDSIFFTANEHGAGIRTGDYLVPGLNFLTADGWLDRKSTRLNTSHECATRLQSSARKKKNTN